MTRGTLPRKFAGALLAACLAFGPACDDGAPADPDAGMREIYYLSDLQGQIQPFEGMMLAALEQQRPQFSAEQFEAARRVVQRTCNAEALEERVLDRLEGQAERDHLDAALAWLRTSAVEKVMQAKISVTAPKGLEAMQDFLVEKQANPPSKRRLGLIERYDDAAHISGIASEITLLSTFGVAALHDSLRPAEQRLGVKALREDMVSKRPLLKPLFKEASAVSSLFAFRELSDDQVESIVVFSESEAGKWYYGTTSAALLNSLLDTTKRLGADLAIELASAPAS